MKILLNGATGGSNFGDYLFAEIFQNEIEKFIGKENIYWYDSRYQLSDFYKKHLNYRKKKCRLSEIDALICISGGYFCGEDKSFKDYIIRYLRYFRICIKCINKKIPYIIIGIDVAHSKFKILDKIQKYVLKNAKIVTVRNVESIKTLKEYGITTGILTADTAHTVDKTLLRENQKHFDGKNIFFHVQMNRINDAQKIIPALNKFLETHTEYNVYVGTDQLISNDNSLKELAARIRAKHVKILPFDYPVDLCFILSEMDFIITPKLHVGIVGATLGKSVLSFSIHSEKISRFYNQLNESGRSLPMAEFTEEKALKMMENYYNKPIKIPEYIRNNAFKNLAYVDDFVKSLPAFQRGEV